MTYFSMDTCFNVIDWTPRHQELFRFRYVHLTSQGSFKHKPTPNNNAGNSITVLWAIVGYSIMVLWAMCKVLVFTHDSYNTTELAEL